MTDAYELFIDGSGRTSFGGVKRQRVRARTRRTGAAGIHHQQERDDRFLRRETRSVCSQGV